MNCQEFKEIIDSYISDELLVETNHDVLRHLENCPACRREIAERRNFRQRLRLAVRSAPDAQIDPVFAARLKENLRATAVNPQSQGNFSFSTFFNPRNLIAASAFVVLLIALAGAFWINSHNSSPERVIVAENEPNNLAKNEPNNLKDKNTGSLPSQSPLVQAVQIAWREMMHVAVGDHQNCALKFNLKEKPISLAEAAEKYGKFNKDLEQSVIKPLHEVFPAGTPGEVKLIAAHSCVFNGRRFAHIILRRQNQTISILVTAMDASNEAGGEITNQATDNLQVAGFRTEHYAVFVVSDLPAAENLTVAQTIFNPVRQQIENSNV